MTFPLVISPFAMEAMAHEMIYLLKYYKKWFTKGVAHQGTVHHPKQLHPGVSNTRKIASQMAEPQKILKWLKFH